MVAVAETQEALVLAAKAVAAAVAAAVAGEEVVVEGNSSVAVEHIEDIDRVDMKDTAGFEDIVVHLSVDPVESIEVQDTLAKEGMREKSNAGMNIVMRELSCCLSFYKYIYTHLFI
jgi:hypothetical protein